MHNRPQDEAKPKSKSYLKNEFRNRHGARYMNAMFGQCGTMNILHICPNAYGMGGGVSEYIRNVSERLAKRHEVTVFTTNPGKKFPRYAVINGVRVERFPRIAPRQSYFFSLGMALRLRQVEFDVVHAHNYHNLPMHFSDLTKSKKLVVSTHFHGAGHSPFRNSLFTLFKPFGKRILRKAYKIVAVSQYEKSLLCKQFGLDSKRVIIIPCGLNLSEFKNLRRHEHDFKSILYVGRLEKYKGVQYLVDILPRLSGDVFLEIVGKGSIRKSLEERAKKLKVYERVRFHQDLPRDKLLQKYADADLFVLLSRYEAYSMVVAEALAAGTPCVVAKTSALQEWIDNENCFGVDLPIDIDVLSKLTSDLLEVKISRRVLGKRLTSKISDWNEVVRQLETIYYDDSS